MTPVWMLLALLIILPYPAAAAELRLYGAAAPLPDPTEMNRPDQLPHSRVALGNLNIRAAWLAGPTDRYPHGVLGDHLEASWLVIETSAGRSASIELPPTRVFEDLEPRLADLNGDGADEIIVVESDIALGACLAVYGLAKGRLRRIAATPFLGRPQRWLNPVGVGDFDGDGRPDIALVATPHVGGILRLYRFEDEALLPFAEYPGVSTHRIGSTQLGLGRVVSARPRDRLLLPDQKHRTILLLEWTPEGWNEITRIDLPAALESSLFPIQPDRWRLRLANGQSFEMQLQ